MAVHRFALLTNKEANETKRAKKDIAKLLENGKEELARIRTEHIIRGDFKLEAYEILSLHCEVLVERLSLIVSLKECPSDLRESISTIMWAAPRVEIPELAQVHKMFTAKYGKDFAKNAMTNADGVVNDRVITKLSIQPPNSFLVLSYMREIAKAYNVDWSPSMEDDINPGAPMPAPVGNDVHAGAHSGISVSAGNEDGSAMYVPNNAKGGGGGSNRGDDGPGAGGGGGGGGGIPQAYVPVPVVQQPGVSEGLSAAAQSNMNAGLGAASMPNIPMPPSDMPTAVVDIPQVPQVPQVPQASAASQNQPTVDIPMPPSDIPTAKPVVDIPMPPTASPDAASAASANDGLPSFDELAARFDALKK